MIVFTLLRLFFSSNIITGIILDSYGYFMLEVFFIICLEIALLAAAFLYVYNSVKKGMLNDSPAVRRAKQELLDQKPNATVATLADSPVAGAENDDGSKTTLA